LNLLACLPRQHDLSLTWLAISLCVAASGATIFLLRKGGVGGNPAGRGTWTMLAGLVCGVGVWATHFIAMLAFTPGLPAAYDPLLTFASLAVAALGAQAGLMLAASDLTGGYRRPALGGAVLGLTICTMHYLGMAGYQIAADLRWAIGWVLASIAAAVGLGALAVVAAVRWHGRAAAPAAAGILAATVAIAHFAGMAALRLTPNPARVIPEAVLSHSVMAILSLAGAVIIAASAMAGALADSINRVRLQRRLAETIEAMPNAVAIFGPDERLGVWNTRFGRLLQESCGFPAAVGLGVSELARAGLRAADGGQYDAPEGRLLLAPGAPPLVQTRAGQWLRTTIRPTAEQGFVTSWVDITDLKQAELAMTAARAEAEAALAAKTEFLANMSHELRTPLTSIIGFTKLMAQLELSPQLAQFVTRVDDASHALLCTVNDILEFSKLEAGQVAITLAPVDIADLGRGVLAFFEPQAAAKDLALSIDLARLPDTGLVMLDADRVRQLLLNLIGNAVKFTEAGAVALAVDYDAEKRALRLEVRDTGPGIAPEDQERLFQRFSQIDGSLTRTGGTGLGLAICKGLIEAMDGTCGVVSAVGRGSTFWLQIPAALADARPRPKELIEAPIDLDGARVLVVDDHAANSDLALIYLGSVGAEVTVAEDGVAALERSEEAPFDVILMDINMPGLDGLATLAAIRRGSPVNRSTPALAFTADVEPERVARLSAAGFAGVVMKPVNPADLLAQVSEACAFCPADSVAAKRA